MRGLEMTILVKEHLPAVLHEAVRKKTKPSGYYSFLKHMEHEQERRLELMKNLESNDRENLARWIRSEFSGTKSDVVNIACSLPVWPIHSARGGATLAALNDVTILPTSMPSNVLRPFTTSAVIDWENSMKSVKKEVCTVKYITELLHVAVDTPFSVTQRNAYKQFCM